MIDAYTWSGGREAVLRLGPADARIRIVFAPALFEEANRTRAFLVAVMRTIAAAGIATALPDLPGTNESMVPTERATLADWRSAFAEVVAERASLIVTLRGGALVDAAAAAHARYRIAPLDGAEIVRDLFRIRRAGDAGFNPAQAASPGPPIELAGHLVSRALLADLRAAPWPQTGRIVRLASGPAAADRKFAGPPIWRAVEPIVDVTLVAAIAGDIVTWARQCAG